MQLLESQKYTAENYGVQSFHRWLMGHEKCQSFTNKQWSYIFRALEFSEEIHKKEARKVSQDAYITHPLGIIEKYLEDEQEIDFESIMTFILHDNIEAKTDCWKGILRNFGIRIFLRVLKLSKPTLDLRAEISKLLLSEMTSFDCDYVDLVDAMDMLHIYDEENRTDSFYHLTPEEHQSFWQLVYSYKAHLEKYFPNMSQEDYEVEIGSCWNYAFFDEKNALHKYYDTVHNISDIEQMYDEDKKMRYILRRIPKINALMMVLKHNNMNRYIDSLKSIWTQIGGTINSDSSFGFPHSKILAWQMHQRSQDATSK